MDFVVVWNNLICLIGSIEVQEMDLLTVQADQFVAELDVSTNNKRMDERRTDHEKRMYTYKTAVEQLKCALRT